MALALTERSGRQPTWEGKFTVDDDTSDYLFLPALSGRYVAVGVIPGANGGKIQHTISSISAVEGGSAIWYDWPHGMVSANKMDYLLSPITAIRFVASGGEVDFEVLI